MNRDEVVIGLADIISGTAGVDRAEVTPDRPVADLGVDSLMMVDVVVAAEDRFGLMISDDRWMRFRTVGELADYIERAAAITPN